LIAVISEAFESFANPRLAQTAFFDNPRHQHLGDADSMMESASIEPLRFGYFLGCAYRMLVQDLRPGNFPGGFFGRRRFWSRSTFIFRGKTKTIDLDNVSVSV